MSYKPKSNWVTFTPTGSWTQNCTYQGAMRIDGNHMLLRMGCFLTGAPNATTFYFNLPPGISIDDTLNIFGASANAPANGLTVYRDNEVADYNGAYPRVDVVNGRIYPKSSTGADFNATTPFTFASGDHIWMEISLPITYN